MKLSGADLQYNIVCNAQIMDEMCIFWFGNQRGWHQRKECALEC